MDRQEPPQPVDWDGVDDRIATKILEQGEVYLKAQLEVALASDRRALSVGTVLSTAATGLFGGTIALYQHYPSPVLLITGFCTAFWIALAGYLSFRAAWPTKFHIAGNHPRQWWPHLKSDYVLLVGRETEGYQVRIDENNDCIDACVEELRRGIRCVVTAPAILLIAWIVSLYLFPS